MTDHQAIADAYNAIADATIDELHRTLDPDECWLPETVIPIAKACAKRIDLPFPLEDLDELLLFDVVQQKCIAEAYAMQMKLKEMTLADLKPRAAIVKH
jgi:hypothetical protein